MGKPIGNLKICAFRQLKNVSLQQLGRVNLLVGVNNSGKTTVLEAISTYCRPLDCRTEFIPFSSLPKLYQTE